jgi:Tol biopolymer transport system component
MRCPRLTGSAFVLAATCLLPVGASANVPGKNGRIAFVHLSGAKGSNQDIFTMSPTGRNLKRLTKSPGDDAFPNYSPNGRKIAFSHGGPGSAGVGQAWVMNTDGSHKRQLTHGSPTVESTTFSPTGRRIAFTRGGGDSPQLWTMKADGTDQTKLTSPGPTGDHVHGPTYSPDGRLIAFTHHYGAVGFHGISVIKPNGTGEVALTAPSAATDDYQPDFSPNGKTIVFDRYNQIQDDLYVMKADGSGAQALTNTSELDLSPAYSPDGRKVIFERDNMDFTMANIVTVDSTGLNQDVTPLTTNSVPVQDFEPGWQPLQP